MTYREWLITQYPHTNIKTTEIIALLGIQYRRYVKQITEMDPVDYFHMSNDKGFSSWLRNIMCQRSVGEMKDTYRNGFILWTIYKKKVKARLVKFIDDEGFMRDIEQPREIYYDEATNTDPEVYEQIAVTGREPYVQAGSSEEWAKEFLHDPKPFEAIKEFGLNKHWAQLEKAAEQIRSQFDPIIPDHYGGQDDPYEAIKVINAWGLGFCLGNVLKYIKRTGKKGDPTEDLKKAKRYLELEIEKYDIHG